MFLYVYAFVYFVKHICASQHIISVVDRMLQNMLYNIILFMLLSFCHPGAKTINLY